MSVELIPLHQSEQRPELTEQCIDVLNEEWPRSRYSRMISLDKSCEDFPVSLCLLVHGSDDSKDQQTKQMIGHSKLCRIPGKHDECWVESVVVSRALRGKGYGKVLMTKTEEYAITKGFRIMVLSTHDKQRFYAKCGFDFCPPVCVFGANAKLLDGEKFAKFRAKFFGGTESAAAETVNLDQIQNGNDAPNNNQTSFQSPAAKATAPPPPPPPSKPSRVAPPAPPPPPPSLTKLTKSSIVRLEDCENPPEVDYMRKILIVRLTK